MDDFQVPPDHDHSKPGVISGPLLDRQKAVVGRLVGVILWAGHVPARELNVTVVIEGAQVGRGPRTKGHGV